MSEKMDGVRGYWDGVRFISRQGKILSCPSWFTSTLPTHITLDGELWMGRETTNTDVTTVLNSKNGDWNLLEYYIFDIPSSTETFEVRMKEIETFQSVLDAHIHIVEHTRCKGTEHLLE